MFECKICNKTFKSILSLSLHISKSKDDIHNITMKQYYDTYIGSVKLCKTCGKETQFLNLNKGYFDYCSSKCVTINSDVKLKTKETWIKKYGVDCPLKSEDIKRKIRESYLKKYGVDHNFKSIEVRESIKKTNIEKYGFEYPTRSEKIKDKTKETNLEKYGCSHFMKTEEGISKFQNTMIRLYGDSHPLSLEIFKRKVIETWKNKSLKDKNIFSDKTRDIHLFKMFQRLINSDRLKDLITPNFVINDYKGVNQKYSWTCKKCGSIFEDHLDNGHIPKCPYCFPKNKSKSELEILSFVQQYFPNAESGNRSILNGKEIDIYIPEIKLGIEFNGLYWHSELNNISYDYHLNKYLKCKEKGIQLIQIFEDEWIEKQEIVKSILLDKMDKIENKINAKDCQLREVFNEEAKQFLFENHLQENINCSVYLGLYYQNILISILAIGKSRFNKNYEYEIYRFCSKLYTYVIGGFSKLIKYFIKHYNSESIITCCDRRYGEDHFYLNSEFQYFESTSPNYYYIKNYRRENRIKYQKHKLSNLLEIFDPLLTEWENMQLNGFDRIWDCGNNVYIYNGENINV